MVMIVAFQKQHATEVLQVAKTCRASRSRKVLLSEYLPIYPSLSHVSLAFSHKQPRF
jgi:hypothetical protein